MLQLARNRLEETIGAYGKLELVFEHRQQRTKLIDCYQAPPLKASRALYPNHDHQATVFLMESSGGLVAGDLNEYKIHVKEGGSVCLKPQSATKVYPSFNELPSRQSVSIVLEDRAELVWDREEIIPFKDSKFIGSSSVEMRKSSTLLWGEILYPGRDKRGECFLFQECNTHLEVWVEDDCIVYDSLSLNPSKQQLKCIGALEGYNYIGSAWFISPHVENIDEGKLIQELTRTIDHKAGITKLNGNGILVRWLSNSLPLLKREMEKVFKLLK
ncbi:urease accessory protein UreD [Bacillus sp. Marseille-P3661]|uniref:urease accessory protein UreD n=1 Tax=Bacillus sp. Marseille-P3661 TaxID=1936234 RepID=UPI000C85B07A|nr:urease accessory protein UreD [Bacillus sp. Marseille-P3661]